MLSIVKKNEITGLMATLYRLGAIVASLCCAAIIIVLMGYSPVTVFSKIVEGSLLSGYRLQETISKAIPLVVLSLGVCVAFKMKFWNIGAEGQLYLGAMGATWVVFCFPNLPAIFLIPLMMIAAAIAGGLWALIPAVLKLKLGTSETLVTLMLNYIAVKWVAFLQYGPWKDPTAFGFAKIARFPESAVLPKLWGVHIGWVITLVLVALMYFVLKHTKFGFELEVVGENSDTAHYVGMNLSRILIGSILLSGGLCGLAGMMQASGIERSLSYQMSGGLGFTAVSITWMARLSPPVILIVSFLFAMLFQGSVFLQSSLSIPAAVAELIQGIILFFVLGSEFFLQYRVVFARKVKRTKTTKEVM